MGAHADGNPALDSAAAARNLAAGTLTRYGALFLQLAVGVLLLPFTLRHLGAHDYGLWMLIASMMAYFQLLDLGFGASLVRYIADADARHDVDGVNHVASTFVLVYTGIGMVAAMGIAAVSLWILPRFPNLSPDDVSRGQLLLAMMGVRIVVGFPMSVYGAVSNARQRFALNTAVACLSIVVNALLTYVVLSAGYGLLALVAATTTAGILTYPLYRWTARRAFPELRLRPTAFRASLVGDILSFSMYLLVLDMAVQISLNIDNLVVGSVMGTAAVAVYAIAFRLADMQRQLCNQLNGLLFPVVVRMDTTGDRHALRSVLIDGTRIGLTLVVGVTICLLGFATPLVLVWIGPGFDGAVPPLVVLALVGIVLVGQGPLGNTLLASGRHKLVACTALTESLVNLVLSLVLVRRYGLVGVALGTAVPIVIGNLGILLPAVCRQLGMPVRRFVSDVATAPAIGAIPAIAVCLLLRRTFGADSLWAIAIQAAVVGATYAAAVWVAGFERNVRERYVAHARQLAAALAVTRPAAHAAPRIGL
jgi:O-antigen/teichoic acid export membrane protein